MRSSDSNWKPYITHTHKYIAHTVTTPYNFFFFLFTLIILSQTLSFLIPVCVYANTVCTDRLIDIEKKQKKMQGTFFVKNKKWIPSFLLYLEIMIIKEEKKKKKTVVSAMRCEELVWYV